MENSKIFLTALSCFPPLGPKRLLCLKNYFSSWQEAFEAPTAQIAKAGVGEKISEEFGEWRKNFKLENLLTILEKEQINVVSLEEKNYPQPLSQTYDPPFILFYKGEMRNEEKALAVVGSRKCTPYGAKVVEKIIPALVKGGLTIASGLALGIDALAHSQTLANGGRTIAVLGSGIDNNSIYPAANRNLAWEIIKSGGCLLSEFPPLAAPLKQNFPRRNRIISGLSLGTFVVEAGEKSGSLITARYALEDGRGVFAAPGSIFSWQSEGPNKLIREGAKPVLGAQDILEDLGLETNEPNEKKTPPDWSGMSEEERSILVNLSSEPTNINDLKRIIQLDIKIINSTLTILEIKGIAKNIGGGNYILL